MYFSEKEIYWVPHTHNDLQTYVHTGLIDNLSQFPIPLSLFLFCFAFLEVARLFGSNHDLPFNYICNFVSLFQYSRQLPWENTHHMLFSKTKKQSQFCKEDLDWDSSHKKRKAPSHRQREVERVRSGSL